MATKPEIMETPGVLKLRLNKNLKSPLILEIKKKLEIPEILNKKFKLTFDIQKFL